MPSNIPWDQLKAETIRSLCADLGAKRFNSRAVGLEFLQNVENDGGAPQVPPPVCMFLLTVCALTVEAALAVEKEKEVTAPKRKAERPAKETQVEPERRSKRARKSVGGATPVKSRRQSRAEERTMKKFDGVELPTKSQPSRRSSRAARSSSAQADDEETEGVPDKDSKGESTI